MFLCLFRFPIGMLDGVAFHASMDLYSGLRSYLEVRCLGMVSFMLAALLVFAVDSWFL